MRGATYMSREPIIQMLVSIHAPHAGRDHQRTAMNRQVSVSIHAPHAGRDPSACVIVVSLIVFQSTRPMRGATACRRSHCPLLRSFNPRAPCGARQINMISSARTMVFQSTRPMRGATTTDDFICSLIVVSIHAPHAGRDDVRAARRASGRGFNPRAPCGARLVCP